MKKIIFLFCFITLLECSKSEDVSLVPDNSIEVSHITNDDLALVDGYIQLVISKEDAIERGVPASEYDLVEETLIKHNKGKVETKSVNNNILAWGMLFYQEGNLEIISQNANKASHYYLEADSMTLYYTFTNNSSDYSNFNYLYYGLNGPVSYATYEFGWENSQGYTPLWNFTGSWITLEYIIEGSEGGTCVYEIRDDEEFY